MKRTHTHAHIYIYYMIMIYKIRQSEKWSAYSRVLSQRRAVRPWVGRKKIKKRRIIREILCKLSPVSD